MRVVALAAALIVLTGCSVHSSNIRVGNDMTYASIGDQREAARTIGVLTEVPSSATTLGEVSAGRCHRSFVEEGPAEQTLLLDLKIAAYVLGADAVSDVRIEKKSALSRNCWYVLDGRAKAVRLR